MGMKINSIVAETWLRWIRETKEISVMLAGLSKQGVSYFPTETWNPKPETLSYG